MSDIAELELKIAEKYKNGVLICLSCLNTGCGRYQEKHALKHVNDFKDHSLVIHSKTLDVWCYECDEDLNSIA